MSVVLITGSCGLVGSESVEFFISKGFDVIGIDNNSRLEFFGKDGDISWIRNNLIKSYKNSIKLIIHSAAQPSHDWAKKRPFVDFNINALGTLNLLNLTKKYSYNAPFVFLSTNKVYGDNPNSLPLRELNSRWEIVKKNKFFRGIDESMSLDNCVHSFFGASKSYADLIVQEYGKNEGLKTVCFRAGCITGPNHSGARLHGFLSYLVKSSLKYHSYSVYGYKGKQVRDNIHSYDLVKCFWNYFKKPRVGEVYNIGGGRKSNCSVVEALNSVESILNIKVKRIFHKTNRVGDHIWYISDTTKFKKHYPNWKQKYNIKEIIEELVYSFQ